MDAFKVGAEQKENLKNDGFAEVRQRAIVSMDFLSANDLAKFTGTDVADVIIKIPGVSVTRGQFAVVRGLSERYNVTTLNGVVVPSADPEYQGVQLDLFPAALMDNIVVRKTYSPELPGNASGGAVLLETAPFPVTRYAKISVGFRSPEDGFRNGGFYSYPTGGSFDNFALGSRDRLEKTQSTGRFVSEPQPGATRQGRFPIGTKFSAAFGGKFKFANRDRRLGYNFALGYDSEASTDQYMNVRGEPNGNGGLSSTGSGRDRFTEERSLRNVQMSGLANVAFNMDAANRIQFTGFFSQTAQDRSSFVHNVVDLTNEENKPITHQLRYRERFLGSFQLGGQHRFEGLHNGQLEWKLARNIARENEPDTRDTFYPEEGNIAAAFGRRTWRETKENQNLGEVVYKQPLNLHGLSSQDAFFALGASKSRTVRTYDDVVGSSAFFPRTPVKSPSEISYSSYDVIAPPNALDAGRDLKSLFATANLFLGSHWEALIGVRSEDSTIRSQGFSYYQGSPSTTSVTFYRANPALGVKINEKLSDASPENIRLIGRTLDRTDYLPALHLTYRLMENTNLRLAVSKTLAKPSLREFGNYFSYDSDGNLQHGNVDLNFSKVRNVDFRAEHFFGGGDLVAASLFWKQIENPIEKFSVVEVAAGQPRIDTWLNNPADATVSGFELEGRKNLGFLGEVFDNWSFGANYAYIKATVDRTAEELLNPSNKGAARRLYDQPGWLANSDVTWASERLGTSVTLSFFAIDKTLYVISPYSYNLYTSGYTKFDLVISQAITKGIRLRASVGNLFDSERKIIFDPESAIYAPAPYRSSNPGRTYSLSGSWNL